MNILEALLCGFFGSKAERDVRRLRPVVRRINAIDEEFKSLDDDALHAKTAAFKERIARGESTDKLLPEAFAAVKNAARRMLGLRFQVCGIEQEWDMVPYDVQLMAGIVLHRRGIAEMATGEGKTLSAAMPLYLNALEGRGCHLVTVNDYLARRDAEWIGGIFRFLGLSVGCLQLNQSPDERRQAYACDITYGTNSEFGFDYLRDNGMALSMGELVQREPFYAIVDEVDSILIDEARTPLIIAGNHEHESNQFDVLRPRIAALAARQQAVCNKLYLRFRQAEEGAPARMESLLQLRLGMPNHPGLRQALEDPSLRRALERFDYELHGTLLIERLSKLKAELYYVVDEKRREIELTDKGHLHLARGGNSGFILPDYEETVKGIEKDRSLSGAERKERLAVFRAEYAAQLEYLQNLKQLLQAYCLFVRDVHYVVQEDKIVIVDEHTGRVMPGRRFSDGLHQALEAKEELEIESENLTFATITLQNYFRLYKKLAGMTGTASTEAGEFQQIYKLDTTRIPTNRPCLRQDMDDLVFRTRREKFSAVLRDVTERYAKGQPILLGTPSVEDSEQISRMLHAVKIPHQVLNARKHRHEAELIALAGQRGCVTVATNMAGRGTDIKLGEGVADLGGLHVIGSSRHEARRIDLQLAGRAARQGDPGSSRFYVSLEDSYIRLHQPERLVACFERTQTALGEPLSHPYLNRIVRDAQKKQEVQHYAIRKQTLDYDDVMNKQRTVIYALRREILAGDAPGVHRAELLLPALRKRIADAGEPREIGEGVMDYTFDWDALLDSLFEGSGRRWKAEDFGGSPGENPRSADRLAERLAEKLDEAFRECLSVLPEEYAREVERRQLLAVLDDAWVDHLNGMEQLRDYVWLRTYAQKDPLVEYRNEAFAMFTEYLVRVAEALLCSMFTLSASEEQEEETTPQAAPARRRRAIRA